jgi:hypothetical protein
MFYSSTAPLASPLIESPPVLVGGARKQQHKLSNVVPKLVILPAESASGRRACAETK